MVLSNVLQISPIPMRKRRLWTHLTGKASKRIISDKNVKRVMISTRKPIIKEPINSKKVKSEKSSEYILHKVILGIIMAIRLMIRAAIIWV